MSSSSTRVRICTSPVFRNTPIAGNESNRPLQTTLRLTWSPPWRPKPEKTHQKTPHGAEPILKPNDPRVLAHQRRAPPPRAPSQASADAPSSVLESLSAGVRTTRLMLDNFPNRGITDSDTAWIVHNGANYKRDALSGYTEQPAAPRGSDAAPETHDSTLR